MDNQSFKQYRLKKEPTASKIDFKAELNSEQYQVVTGGDGPCLVLAGPGSGKTRTLVYRVAFLLSQFIPPDRILLLTFTNKAAREMLRRVELLLGRYPTGLVGGTFHHAGNLALRRYADRIGYRRNFTILDRSDSKDCLAEVVGEMRLGKERYFPKADVLQGIISFSVNSCQDLAAVLDRQYPYLARFQSEIERAAAAYQARKLAANSMDYDDLLSQWNRLLVYCPEARDYFQDRFRSILVDEYQDTNRLQFEILKSLAGRHGNLMVVGDDAQSIYSFRAAEVRNTLDFKKFFPGARIARLETNYRSVPEILELANRSIAHNQNQFPKELKSTRPAGPRPVLVVTQNAFSEARFVAQRLLELREEGTALSDIAVLFRARYQVTELELELAARGIPYLIRGGIRFYEQAHIKDVLAYLKLLVNDRDELAWRRILLQLDGIGPGYFRRFWSRVSAAPVPMETFLEPDSSSGLPFRSRPGFAGLQKLFRELRRDEYAGQPAAQIKAVLEGDYRSYCLSNYTDGPERLREIEELARIALQAENTERFLAETVMGENFKGESFDGNGGEEQEMLTLSTIHQAKGLEWKAVFIISLADGRFPFARALEEPEGLEEERRLFYVAITRAKQYLYLMQPVIEYGWEGNQVQRLSTFVQELPESDYETWLAGDSNGSAG